MQVELDGWFWDALAMMRLLYDHGNTTVLDHYRETEICGDHCFELAWESIATTFKDTRSYLNEEKCVETLVLYDPIMDNFYRLCERYEQNTGLSCEENPYRKEMASAIHCSFTLDDYSYDYMFSMNPNSKKGCRIVFLMYEEFFAHYELAEALWNIRDAFAAKTKQLETELANIQQKKIIPLPMAEPRKEAA